MTARLVSRGIAAAGLLALGGCNEGVLAPVGPVGTNERTILFNALGIMLAIVVPTIVTALGTAWWFRDGNDRAKRLPHWEYSGKIEMVVWAVPAMTVMLLAGICWIGSHELDPPRPLASPKPALEVQVVALDWKWLFIYPAQGVASVNRLVVPTGTPLRFDITSATVMNSFFVPRLGSQIYAMAGMATRVFLQADRPGQFAGLSAMFSGDGFPEMRFMVQALPQAGFDAWVSQARRGGPVLDQAGYQALAQESVVRVPFSYRRIDAALFRAVVMQTAPPPQTPQPAKSGRTLTIFSPPQE